MKILNITVKDEDGEVRLDRWVKRYYPQFTQGMIQKLCRTGQIRVDKKRIQASTHLNTGNVVRLPLVEKDVLSSKKNHDMDSHFSKKVKSWIIYEDSDLFVINKPSGIAVQGGSNVKYHIDGMLEALRENSNYRPCLVHRLDKDTSGILLIARHPAAAAKLTAAFRGRAVKKIYWAITTGRPVSSSGRVTLPLLKVERPGESYVVVSEENKNAQKAVTEYMVKDYAARKFAWVELYPLTGRMHQLRVHCSAMNCPILGDRKYNQVNGSLEGFPELLHLHARAIIIPHPQGGYLEVEVELSSHMKETFKRLGFDMPSGNCVKVNKR